MKNIILKANDLCKSFANNGLQNHVLNHIGLELYEGDFTVIMGSSGSGKSTLLYSLSGMDTVTSGQVIFKDKDITGQKETSLAYLRRKDFGFVFQKMHLVSNLTIFENIAVPGYLAKDKGIKKVNQQTEELLKLLEIEDIKTKLPSQVSGGEQQRACIARTLINSPALLFADEPTGSLNRKAGEEVLDLLTKFNEMGQTILMVTHDVKAAARAGRILYLEDGKIVGDMNLKPFSGETYAASEKQVVAWLSARGW